MMHDEEFIPVAVEWTTAVGADGVDAEEDSEWEFWEDEAEEGGEADESLADEFIDEYRRFLAASEVPEYTPEEIDEQFRLMLSMVDSSDDSSSGGGPETHAQSSSDDSGAKPESGWDSLLAGSQTVVGRWFLPGAAVRGRGLSSAGLHAVERVAKMQDLVSVDGGELALVEAKGRARRAVGLHDWGLLVSMLVAWADPRGEAVPGFRTEEVSRAERFMDHRLCPREAESSVGAAVASAVARGTPHVLVLVAPDAGRRWAATAALERWSSDRTELRSRWQVGWDGDLPELAAAVVLHERASLPRPAHGASEVAALMLALPEDLRAAQNISRIQSFVHASLQECLQRIDLSRSP
ncbi:hypothetical protein [Streptomyces sp. NPDC054865]